MKMNKENSEKKIRKHLVHLVSEAIRFFSITIKILFAFRPKVYFLATTSNSNLGDNAQLLCIREWILNNYPKHTLVEISVTDAACHVAQVKGWLRTAFQSWLLVAVMRLKQRKGDLIIGNSGYHFIDHSSCWLTFARVAVACKKTRIVIMPVTVNFLNPWIGDVAAKALNAHGNVTILCRDTVSLEKASVKFINCCLIAWPDVVTTMLASDRVYQPDRSGVLFCLRDDGEGFYSEDSIKQLILKLGDVPIAHADTTLPVSRRQMRKKRAELIAQFVDQLSRYRVVVTDRYHGTIFSLVADTPVVVIDSTDHKLRSGVKWYPESFSEMIAFAEDLDEAYERIQSFYKSRPGELPDREYFKREYYDKLKETLDGNL